MLCELPVFLSTNARRRGSFCLTAGVERFGKVAAFLDRATAEICSVVARESMRDGRTFAVCSSTSKGWTQNGPLFAFLDHRETGGRLTRTDARQANSVSSATQTFRPVSTKLPCCRLTTRTAVCLLFELQTNRRVLLRRRDPAVSFLR